MPSRLKFYDLWVKGDDAISLDVQFAVNEKAENFNPLTDVRALRQIAEEHHNKTPKGAVMTSTADNLLVDELELALKHYAHDMQIMAVYRQKSVSTEENATAALKQWAVDQNTILTDAAKVLMQKHVILTVWPVEDDNGNKTLGELMEFRQKIVNRMALVKQHQLKILPLVNWCSPSQHSSVAQKLSLTVSSWSLNDDQQNVGVVLMPVHTHQKNQLVMSETSLLGKLSKCNVIADYSASILFKERLDGRDSRPLNYPCRIMFPGLLQDVKTSMWFRSQLRCTGRTEMVNQLAGRAMLCVEDLSPDALPATDDDRYISGPKKAEQVGVEAWEGLIDALIKDTPLDIDDGPKTQGILFVLPTTRVGEELLAIFNVAARTNTSSLDFFMMAISETEVEKLWIENALTDHLKVLIKAKKLFVAGTAPIEDKISDKDVTPYLLLPTFKKLIPTGNVPESPGNVKPGETLPRDQQLSMPVDIYKYWTSCANQELSNRFLRFVEDNSLPVLAEPVAAESLTPDKKGKRGTSDVDVPGPPTKKAKFDPSTIVTTSDITEALLFDVKIAAPQKSDKVHLHLRVGARYLVNLGLSEVTVPSNFFMAGFGKGNFKLLKGLEETPPDNSIEFSLTDSESLVVYNNCVTTIGAILQVERLKKPDLAPCYHKVIDNEADSRAFTLQQTHRIVFVPAGESNVTASNVALKAAGPKDLSGGLEQNWSSHLTRLMWKVRLTNKGVQAITPAVYTVVESVIPPGSAVKF